MGLSCQMGEAIESPGRRGTVLRRGKWTEGVLRSGAARPTAWCTTA